jgi:hypothetical protein
MLLRIVRWGEFALAARNLSRGDYPTQRWQEMPNQATRFRRDAGRLLEPATLSVKEAVNPEAPR